MEYKETSEATVSDAFAAALYVLSVVFDKIGSYSIFAKNNTETRLNEHVCNSAITTVDLYDTNTSDKKNKTFEHTDTDNILQNVCSIQGSEQPMLDTNSATFAQNGEEDKNVKGITATELKDTNAYCLKHNHEQSLVSSQKTDSENTKENLLKSLGLKFNIGGRKKSESVHFNSPVATVHEYAVDQNVSEEDDTQNLSDMESEDEILTQTKCVDQIECTSKQPCPQNMFLETDDDRTVIKIDVSDDVVIKDLDADAQSMTPARDFSFSQNVKKDVETSHTKGKMPQKSDDSDDKVSVNENKVANVCLLVNQTDSMATASIDEVFYKVPLKDDNEDGEFVNSCTDTNVSSWTNNLCVSNSELAQDTNVAGLAELQCLPLPNNENVQMVTFRPDKIQECYSRIPYEVKLNIEERDFFLNLTAIAVEPTVVDTESLMAKPDTCLETLKRTLEDNNENESTSAPKKAKQDIYAQTSADKVLCKQTRQLNPNQCSESKEIITDSVKTVDHAGREQRSHGIFSNRTEEREQFECTNNDMADQQSPYSHKINLQIRADKTENPSIQKEEMAVYCKVSVSTQSPLVNNTVNETEVNTSGCKENDSENTCKTDQSITNELESKDLSKKSGVFDLPQKVLNSGYNKIENTKNNLNLTLYQKNSTEHESDNNHCKKVKSANTTAQHEKLNTHESVSLYALSQCPENACKMEMREKNVIVTQQKHLQSDTDIQPMSAESTKSTMSQKCSASESQGSSFITASQVLSQSSQESGSTGFIYDPSMSSPHQSSQDSCNEEESKNIAERKLFVEMAEDGFCHELVSINHTVFPNTDTSQVNAGVMEQKQPDFAKEQEEQLDEGGYFCFFFNGILSHLSVVFFHVRRLVYLLFIPLTRTVYSPKFFKSNSTKSKTFNSRHVCTIQHGLTNLF